MSDETESWYARPVFFVTDCESAVAFYARLGFTESWRHDDGAGPSAVQVNRDRVELILNRSPARAGGGRLFVSLHPGQSGRLADAFRVAGIEVEDAFWGMPVRIIEDPDGNDLLLYDDELTSG